MSAHYRPGARLAALLLLLALTATPLRAHAQAATRTWSTYLGGSGQERITSVVQVPSNGNVVVGGWTDSADFPPRSGPAGDLGRDAFVAIFASNGTMQGVPTLFGGAGDEQINAVAVDDQGQIYVVGTTQTSNMPGFTVISGGVTGTDAAFLAALGTNGAPDWIMYLDGPGSETALGVTVAGKDIYVTGQTNDCKFLDIRAVCTTAGWEGFVVKVDLRTTPDVAWHTLVPGNLNDSLTQSVVDGSTVVVAGTTSSGLFPYPPLVRKNFPLGGDDALAMGLDVTSGAVSWMYFLGGSADDTGAGIVAGANGKIVVVGSLGTSTQGKNVFATWMDSAGEISRTERKGGSEDEVASSVAADTSGNIYVGGRTSSTDFPHGRGFDRESELAIPPTEGFVMVFPAQAGPGWGSYVGGNVYDDVLSLSIRDRLLVMAGETSSSTDLVTAGGYDSTLSAPRDGFIVAVTADITPPQPGTVNDRPQDDLVFEDIPTQTSRDSISANWDGFTDDETPFISYEWAIGARPGGEEVWPFTATSNSLQRSFMQSGLSLNLGSTYYTTVRAINGAGLGVTVSSNGVRVVPVVTDGGTNGGTDGGTDGGTNGGTDGGPDGGPDSGTGEEPEEGEVPLMGWSCTAANAGLPMLVGLLALMLLASRRGSQSR